MDLSVRKGEISPALRSAIRGLQLVLPSVRSSDDGTITLATQEEFGVVRSADPARVVAGEGAAPSGEHVWFVARSRDLVGVTTDETGDPLADASIGVKGSLDQLGTLPPGFRVTEDWDRRTISDEAGRFRMKGIPSIGGNRLTARLEGFEDAELELDGRQGDDVSVVVHMRRRPLAPITGVVRHADGSPARGSLVRYGDATAGSDKDGRFRLERTTGAKLGSLVATLRGYQPASIPAFDPDSVAGGHEVDLILGPAAVAIRGRILRPDGTPCSGCYVALRDDPASPIGYGRTVERAGARKAGIEWGSRAFSPFVMVDSEGAFVLDELSSVSYSLLAFDPRTGKVVELEGVLAGGSPLEIRMPDGDDCTGVSGRLVDCRGEAIPDVEITGGFTLKTSTGFSAYMFVASAKADRAGFIPRDPAGGWNEGETPSRAGRPSECGRGRTPRRSRQADRNPSVTRRGVEACRTGFDRRCFRRQLRGPLSRCVCRPSQTGEGSQKGRNRSSQGTDLQRAALRSDSRIDPRFTSVQNRTRPQAVPSVPSGTRALGYFTRNVVGAPSGAGTSSPVMTNRGLPEIRIVLTTIRPILRVTSPRIVICPLGT